MLADKIQRIGFSSTFRINAKAKKMRAEGIDVIDFSVGEPDFPTPENIKNAAKNALDRNFTRYTVNDGIPELRKAVLKKFREEYGAHYNISNVIISTGAKQCLYNACVALLNKGDEVIVLSPYWVSYPEMIKLAGGVPVYVNTREENGFRVTPEELGRAISPRTKAIILNNPSNPTGSAYPEEDLLKVIDVCMDEGIFIISDEIYEKLIYDGFRLKSVACFGEKVQKNSLIINGFSKAYAMTGWRLGYAVGPEEIIQAMSKVQSHSTSNTNTMAQWAGVEALIGQQHDVSQMRIEFERRRNFLLYKMSAIPHCSCYKPDGAFYIFANLSWYYDKQFEGMQIRNSSGLAYYLLKQAHVALVPGDAFGADNFIRLSYATSIDNLEKAASRIHNALALLKPTVKSRRISLQNKQTKVRDLVEVETKTTPQARDALIQEAESVMSYDRYHEWNVSIGGVILKLATNSPHLVKMWTDNWYPSSLESDLEPHGIIYGIKDAPGRQESAFYNAETRSGVIYNTAYYPQLHSMALGMVDSIASRMFDTFLIGGSCIDVNGRGVALISPPGTGGSTHFANLMRHKESKLHSLNGFFIRWAGGEPVADSLERKILMRTDMTHHLPELTELFDRSNLENAVVKRKYCMKKTCSHSDNCPLDRGEPRCYLASKDSHALLDPYWIGGTTKHVKRSTISKLILLQHDNLGAKTTILKGDAALQRLEEGDFSSKQGGWRSMPFYNRFMLDRSSDRLATLRRQWKRLLSTSPLHVVNIAAMSKDQAQQAIWQIANE
ncbi:MAG: pyridoxal phosphate-dependent aminotransferase [Calditrichaeota bacterium]|nr:pyridoxal phosphate-dependent aminotransferase [Calditrichota bacterium]